MLYHFVVAVLGVIGLAMLWIGVQWLERVVKWMPKGSDVLACWMCENRGGCHCALRAMRDKGKDATRAVPRGES